MNAERQLFIQKYLWVILFFTSLLLSIFQRDYFQLGSYKDDASYILLAKSLISSDHFGSVSGLHSSVIPEFPFGFPLLLSPFLILFPENFGVLKIISLVATLLNVAILYWGWQWLMPGTSTWWGLAVSGLYAVFPLMIRHTSMVMSEPSFTTFCLGTIILAEFSIRQERLSKLNFILIGALLAVCFFIRTIGMALFIALLLYLLLRLRRKVITPVVYIFLGIFFVSSAIILFTPLTVSNLIPERYLQNDFVRITTNRLRSILNPQVKFDPVSPVPDLDDPGEEGIQPTSPLEFIVGGLIFHLQTDIRDVVLPIGGGRFEQNIANRIGLPSIPKFLGLIVSAIILLGIVLAFIRFGPNLFLLFASAYFVFLIFWVWEGQRLIYPIQPQFQFAFLFGLFSLLGAAFSILKNERLSTNLPKFLMVFFVTSMILIATVKSYSTKDSRNNIGDMQLRTRWVGENADSDAVILSGEPTTDYLYVERNILEYPYDVKSRGELSEYLKTASVDYILVAPEIKWQTVYAPIYSERLEAILPYIDQLAAENIISLVHEDKTNLISVYQVNTSVGQ